MRQHAYTPKSPTEPKCSTCGKAKTDPSHERAFKRIYEQAKLEYEAASREYSIADGMRVPPDKLQFLHDKTERLLTQRKTAFLEYMNCENYP